MHISLLFAALLAAGTVSAYGQEINGKAMWRKDELCGCVQQKTY